MKFNNFSETFCGRLSVGLLLGALHACSPQIDITLPAPDSLHTAYPIGVHNAQNTAATALVITRYEAGKPVLLYLPQGEGPYPLVMFQHGRPFTMPSNYAYSPSRELVDATVTAGFALAVVIRSGYFLAAGQDKEIVPCNRPQFADFVAARDSARDDLVSAKNYLAGLSFVDSSKIILAGTSAGGFASVNAMPYLDEQIDAVISLNGGRCGSRGDAIGGLAWQQELYSRVAVTTSSNTYFLSGGKDDVIPSYSTTALFMAFCRARKDCVQRSSTALLTNDNGTHNVATMLEGYSRVLGQLKGN